MDQTLSNQVVNSIRRVIVVHQIDGPFLNGVKTPMSSQNGAQLVLSVSLSLLFFVRLGFGLFTTMHVLFFKFLVI